MAICCVAVITHSLVSYTVSGTVLGTGNMMRDKRNKNLYPRGVDILVQKWMRQTIRTRFVRRDVLRKQGMKMGDVKWQCYFRVAGAGLCHEPL